MNETEKYLLDAAIDLAVTKEFDEFTKLDAGDTELPAALDKRVRGILRRRKFAQFCMDNIRIVAAACLCILVVGIGIGVPLYVEATENDYYMQTEQDMYRNSISVQFLCKEEEVPAENLEREREVLRAQAINEGKPEKIVDRMVEGRIKKYYKEVCLLEQPFVKDGDKNIKALMAEIAKETGATLDIVRFARYERGEGIEKRKDDLAAEIAAMQK